MQNNNFHQDLERALGEDVPRNNIKERQLLAWLNSIKSRKIDFSPFREDISNDPKWQAERKRAANPLLKFRIERAESSPMIAIYIWVIMVGVFMLIFFPWVLIIGGLMFWIASKYNKYVDVDENRIRRENFIERNQMIFTEVVAGEKDGSAFRRATAASKMHVYEKADFEFGHFHSYLDSDRTESRFTFYVEQTLPFEVQNLIIDSRATDEFTVGRIKNPNIVSLEGDFSQYFTIETEASRKSQATAFLAPDMMSMLIDYFRGCEIEFFDNKVRIYFPSEVKKITLFGAQFDLGKIEKNLIHAETFLKKYAEKFNLLEVSRTEFEILEKQKISHTRDVLSNTLVQFFSTILVAGALIVMVMVFYREQIMSNPIALIAYCAITAVIFSIVAISGIDLIKTHIKTKNSGAFVARVRAKKYINPWKAFVIISGVILVIFTHLLIWRRQVALEKMKNEEQALKIVRHQEKLDRSKSQAKILKDSIIWHVRERGDLAYFSKESAGDIEAYRYDSLRSMKSMLDRKEANFPNLGGQICYHFRLEDEKYSIWRDFVIFSFEEKSEYYLTEVNYDKKSEIPADCQKI